MFDISPADSDAKYQFIRELVAEHIAWDTAEAQQAGLSAQEIMDFHFASEDMQFPGEFASPRGCMLLATSAGSPAGCGGFRSLTGQVAELKLIFVRPEFRGHGLGRRIVRELLERARQAGYAVVRLEATTFMTSAIAMYESMGFERCLPWHGIPESFRPMTLFMEKHLD